MRRLYRLLLALFPALLSASGPSFATRTVSADVVEAIWHVQNLAFEYHSANTLYSCESLEEKVRAILLAAGAHPSLKVETRCNGSVTNHVMASIALATPVPATAENVRAATSFDATDELVARVRQVALPNVFTLQRFEASWQLQPLSSIRDARITMADCDLIRNLSEQIFPRISVRIIQQRPACDHLAAGDSFAARPRPNIRLEALIPAPGASF